ncbi:N-acetylmuramoyl-L-alanine amidase [Arenicella xantha]|uniref:N-acetylmuramoyl-L-alanine amidase AmiC n=2 Tax=Arenicella xantha TaxID=644221 RepID=A0A395JHF0_9GAMM|nr:N-acetylmuramoyl-L-alanine amidase [Arenicella xantha]
MRLVLAALMAICLCLAVTVQAQSNAKRQVNNLRIWHAPDKTRLVFDVSEDVIHQVFDLDSPHRVVIDIQNANLKMVLPKLDAANAHISAIRSGRPRDNVLRLVLDLKKQLQQTSFVLTPNELYGYRLVVDLIDPDAAVLSDAEQSNSGATVPASLDPNQSSSSDAPPTTTPTIDASIPATEAVEATAPTLEPVIMEVAPVKKLVVAIDAGHGGEDPGALGHRGSREKVITLEIAKRLKRAVDSDGRMEAVLIRTGDYYIDLNQRRQMARTKGADLFVSIHADAFGRKSANGLSVFALSQSGATSAMAKALAAKENASDLIGGVSLANKDQVLAQVLVDLSMTNTISESVNLGGRVLKELSKVGRLHSKRVEQAGFAVLKSPDMPSILIETGFITNPDEERNLRSSRYQQKIADAVYTAITQYYEQTPYYSAASYAAPRISNGSASTSGATAYHRVVRGDSLSVIAARYGTTMRELKRLNNMRSNTVMLGTRLRVPAPAGQLSSSAGNAARSPVEHVVVNGDSLSKISAQYNITIRAIKSLNNLSKDTLYLGQRLKLPAGSNTPRVPRTHRVRRGDTLSEIALKYGSTEKKIMHANQMRSRTVMLGQTLKIP